MKIGNIQSTNFERKHRFISPAAENNIKFLLQKMNSETVCNSRGETTVLRDLTNTKGDIVFTDSRMYLAHVPENQQMKKKTIFTIGKTKLVINNETGEIIKHHKPFFTTWNRILNKMDEYLEYFKQNFDNKDLVNQKRLALLCFTEEGAKKLN